MSRTPDAVEKAKVRKYLTEIGAYHFWPVPSGYGQPGIDCYACILGTFWAIEVKIPKKFPTARQTQTLNAVFDAKGFIIWGTANVIRTQIENWLANVSRRTA